MQLELTNEALYSAKHVDIHKPFIIGNTTDIEVITIAEAAAKAEVAAKAAARKARDKGDIPEAESLDKDAEEARIVAESGDREEDIYPVNKLEKTKNFIEYIKQLKGGFFREKCKNLLKENTLFKKNFAFNNLYALIEQLILNGNQEISVLIAEDETMKIFTLEKQLKKIEKQIKEKNKNFKINIDVDAGGDVMLSKDVFNKYKDNHIIIHDLNMKIAEVGDDGAERLKKFINFRHIANLVGIMPEDLVDTEQLRLKFFNEMKEEVQKLVLDLMFPEDLVEFLTDISKDDKEYIINMLPVPKQTIVMRNLSNERILTKYVVDSELKEFLNSLEIAKMERQ